VSSEPSGSNPSRGSAKGYRLGKTSVPHFCGEPATKVFTESCSVGIIVRGLPVSGTGLHCIVGKQHR